MQKADLEPGGGQDPEEIAIDETGHRQDVPFSLYLRLECGISVESSGASLGFGGSRLGRLCHRSRAAG